MSNVPSILLDTNAAIFMAGGDVLPAAARTAIEGAQKEDRLFISAVSAWEIGQLVARRRLKTPLSAEQFFDELVSRTGSRICDVTPGIFANSSFLPHLAHRDPADCLLITTARTNDMTIVTRDRTILAYGAEGYVKSIAC